MIVITVIVLKYLRNLHSEKVERKALKLSQSQICTDYKILVEDGG